MNRNLQVWAIVLRDDVQSIVVLCPEHASWTGDPDFWLVDGARAVRVRARAWVRQVLRSAQKRGSGCTECAARAGAPLRLTDAGPLGSIKTSDVDMPGGEA